MANARVRAKFLHVASKHRKTGFGRKHVSKKQQEAFAVEQAKRFGRAEFAVVKRNDRFDNRLAHSSRKCLGVPKSKGRSATEVPLTP